MPCRLHEKIPLSEYRQINLLSVKKVKNLYTSTCTNVSYKWVVTLASEMVYIFPPIVKHVFPRYSEYRFTKWFHLGLPVSVFLIIYYKGLCIIRNGYQLRKIAKCFSTSLLLV